MKKLSMTLACLVLFVVSPSCSHKWIVPNPGPSPSPIASVTPSPSPSPSPGPELIPAPGMFPQTITLKCNETCRPNEVAELSLIQDAMNRTLNSDCFNAYFRTPGRRLDYTNGWDVEKILQKLHTPTTLTVDYFEQSGKVQGYESASDFTVIHMNRRFTSGWKTCEIASLAGHEFSHTKDFYHNGNKPGPNYYSVPYQVNNAFEGNDNMPACCK